VVSEPVGEFLDALGVVEVALVADCWAVCWLDCEGCTLDFYFVAWGVAAGGGFVVGPAV